MSVIHFILPTGLNHGNTCGRRRNTKVSQEDFQGRKTEADLGDFSKLLKKIVIETALDAELTDHLATTRTPGWQWLRQQPQRQIQETPQR